MSAFEVNYLWSEQVYLEASDEHRRFGAANTREKVVTVIVGLLIVVSLFMMFERGFQPTDSMALILAVYWFLIRGRMHKKLLLSRFKNSPQKDKTISLVIDDEGVKAKTGDTLEGQFGWSDITKAVRTSRGFLLYRGQDYIWVPVAAFADSESIEHFAALCERKATVFTDKSDQK